MTPGWETLHERSLVEIAAHQWRVANEMILADLEMLPRDAWHFVHYADLVAAPKPTIQQIAAFAELCWDEAVEQVVAQALPVSRMTFSAPAADKWRKHAAELAPVLLEVECIVQQVALYTALLKSS